MVGELQAQTILEEVPPPRGPAVDGGMLPQIVPGDVTLHPGDAEENDLEDESTHQWRASKAGENIYIEEGTLIHPDIELQVGGHSFAAPTEEWDAWCAITLDDAGVPTQGVIANGSLAVGPPADTEVLIHRRLAEIYNGHWEAPGKFYGKIRQLQFEPIRLGVEGASAPDHQWKVTKVATAEGESPAVNVKGGILRTQAGFAEIVVPDEPGLLAETGTVMLRIERDSNTREYVSHLIEIMPTSSSNDDTTTYQWLPLADIVVEDGKVVSILPRKFEDAAIFDAMAVINGEFYHVPLAMNGRGPVAI